MEVFREDFMFNQDLFCERLKSLREEKGLSQSALGEVLGVSGQAISSMEKGRRTTTVENIYLLSTFFKVTSDYLIGLSDLRVYDESQTKDMSQIGINYKDSFTMDKEACERREEELVILERLLAAERNRLATARALNILSQSQASKEENL
jgi:transcriptional regulator with XRE-family HTH domain